MIKCSIMLGYLKIMLMVHQKDTLEIWKSKRTQKVKPGEKEWTLMQRPLKHKELLMLELLSTKKIQLHIEQLITKMDTMFHMLILHKLKLKPKLENGTQIFFGMLDQSKTIEKVLQLDIVNNSNSKKTIKLGRKHGLRK